MRRLPIHMRSMVNAAKVVSEERHRGIQQVILQKTLCRLDPGWITLMNSLWNSLLPSASSKGEDLSHGSHPLGDSCHRPTHRHCRVDTPSMATMQVTHGKGKRKVLSVSEVGG